MRFIGEDMRTEGSVTLKAFGGSVVLHDMQTDNMFSGIPKILFSADINNVSLKSISRAFGFGEISGTLRGSVKNYEYVLGTANQFDIDLQVVPGESKYVKVDFLHNFLFVTSGKKSEISAQSVFSAIINIPRNIVIAAGTARPFYYKEFGIHAILKNNVLTLDSPYKVNGEEAYMTAPWYGGVNIINANPGRNYKWSPVFTRISNVLSGKGKVETKFNLRPGIP